jgi:hypothetical protein
MSANLLERRAPNLHRHPTPVRVELVEAPFFLTAERKNAPSTSSGRMDHIKRTML